MAFVVHLSPHLQHISVLIQQVGGPFHPHVLASVERLFHPDAKLLDQRFFGVSKKREVKIELVDELLVLLDWVWANAKDLCSLELGHQIAKVAGFHGTARRIVLWIEVDDRLRSEEVFFRPGLAVLVLKFKVWERAANVDHCFIETT